MLIIYSNNIILLPIDNEWSFVMVKNSILLMNVLALGLTLGSAVEAVKSKVVGPMDQFVVIEEIGKRTRPEKNKESDIFQTGPTSSKKKKTSPSKRQRIIFTLETKKTEKIASSSLIENDQLDYLIAMSGNLGGLTPFQSAFVLKINNKKILIVTDGNLSVQLSTP
ncbi:hypothetical protein QM565_29120 [Geitlerinema splendidum]|nr:hypothetical protein [Geitlerinema splendidum]